MNTMQPTIRPCERRSNRRRSAGLWIAWAILAPLLFGAPQAVCAEGREIHVAVDGDDQNDGAADRPAATLAKAMQLLAEMAGQRSDAAVVLHAGVHRIETPLEFRPESTPNGAIVIRAADGAAPVISGGRRIVGLSRDADGKFRVRLADVAAGKWTFRELFVNGQRRQRARHP
ncbi:MAG: hypothetical protein KDA41_18840, partial [Planctomycetales bacterium]|nr:hypothetical protein [Planctomycetales bacterium]